MTGEVELLRKQLADAGHELERLVIAGQVITQLIADDAAAGEPAAAGPAQRGFGMLVPPRGQASGPGDLPEDYRSLVEAPPDKPQARQMVKTYAQPLSPGRVSSNQLIPAP